MKVSAPSTLDQSSHLDSTLGKGMDVAIITGLFLGLGYLLDRWLGTRPWMMIVMVVLALVGEFVRMRYIYEAKMQALEAERREASRAKAAR